MRILTTEVTIFAFQRTMNVKKLIDYKVMALIDRAQSH